MTVTPSLLAVTAATKPSKMSPTDRRLTRSECASITTSRPIRRPATGLRS